MPANPADRAKRSTSAHSCHPPASRTASFAHSLEPKRQSVSHRGRLPGRQNPALPPRATTPCWFHSQASRCFPHFPARKHREDNPDPVVEKTPCSSSAESGRPPTPELVNPRPANATAFG